METIQSNIFQQTEFFHHCDLRSSATVSNHRCCSSFRPEVFLFDVLESSLAKQKSLLRNLQGKWNQWWERCMELYKYLKIIAQKDIPYCCPLQSKKFSRNTSNANEAIVKPQTVRISKRMPKGQFLRPIKTFQQQKGNPKLWNQKAHSASCCVKKIYKYRNICRLACKYIDK